MFQKKNYIHRVIAVFFVLILTIYLFFIQKWVIAFFAGSAPSWFESLVYTFYPRLLVEKERFSADFFLDKANQLVVRFVLVYLTTWLGYILYTKSIIVSTKWKRFWSTNTSFHNIIILRYLFFGLLLYQTWFFKDILINLENQAFFYKSVWFFPLPLPSYELAWAIWLVFYAVSFAALVGVRPVWMSSFSALLFVLMNGYISSFEKIDHTFSTWMYVQFLMPFLLYEAHRNKEKPADWVLKLIWLCIGGTYFLAGLEKLLISHFTWYFDDTLCSYLELSSTYWGLEAVKSTWFCRLLALGVFVFEFGFISVLFKPKLRYLFMPLGIAFHTGVYLLMGVGHYFTPWVMVYIFFIDWAWVWKRTFPSSS